MANSILNQTRGTTARNGGARVITRHPRRSAADIALERITTALRALAGGHQDIDHARTVRDRYAREIGCRAGAGGDDLIAALMSPVSVALAIEEIDELFMAVERGTTTTAAVVWIVGHRSGGMPA